MTEIWVAYTPHFSGQRDDFKSFSNIRLFTDELTALRYATSPKTLPRPVKVVKVGIGQRLEDAIIEQSRG